MLKNNSLRVSVIGTVGVPACYGGFESLVDNLLDFTPQNVEYTVFCSGKKYENRLEPYKGAKLVYLEKDANGIESIFYDFEGMKRSLDSDIMLILGVSGCMFLPFIRRRFKGKIITNIDGLEWRRDKLKWYAKHLLKFSEKMAVRHSDIVIGDNKGITDYVNAEYKKEVKNKRVELIAYGGDHVLPVKDDSLFEKYPFCKKTMPLLSAALSLKTMFTLFLRPLPECLRKILFLWGTGNALNMDNSLKKSILLFLIFIFWIRFMSRTR